MTDELLALLVGDDPLDGGLKLDLSRSELAQVDRARLERQRQRFTEVWAKYGVDVAMRSYVPYSTNEARVIAHFLLALDVDGLRRDLGDAALAPLESAAMDCVSCGLIYRYRTLVWTCICCGWTNSPLRTRCRNALCFGPRAAWHPDPVIDDQVWRDFWAGNDWNLAHGIAPEPLPGAEAMDGER